MKTTVKNIGKYKKSESTDAAFFQSIVKKYFSNTLNYLGYLDIQHKLNPQYEHLENFDYNINCQLDILKQNKSKMMVVNNYLNSFLKNIKAENTYINNIANKNISTKMFNLQNKHIGVNEIVNNKIFNMYSQLCQEKNNFQNNQLIVKSIKENFNLNNQDIYNYFVKSENVNNYISKISKSLNSVFNKIDSGENTEYIVKNILGNIINNNIFKDDFNLNINKSFFDIKFDKLNRNDFSELLNNLFIKTVKNFFKAADKKEIVLNSLNSYFKEKNFNYSNDQVINLYKSFGESIVNSSSTYNVNNLKNYKEYKTFTNTINSFKHLNHNTYGNIFKNSMINNNSIFNKNDSSSNFFKKLFLNNFVKNNNFSSMENSNVNRLFFSKNNLTNNLLQSIINNDQGILEQYISNIARSSSKSSLIQSIINNEKIILSSVNNITKNITKTDLVEGILNNNKAILLSNNTTVENVNKTSLIKYMDNYLNVLLNNNEGTRISKEIFSSIFTNQKIKNSLNEFKSYDSKINNLNLFKNYETTMSKILNNNERIITNVNNPTYINYNVNKKFDLIKDQLLLHNIFDNMFTQNKSVRNKQNLKIAFNRFLTKSNTEKKHLKSDTTNINLDNRFIRNIIKSSNFKQYLLKEIVQRKQLLENDFDENIENNRIKKIYENLNDNTFILNFLNSNQHKLAKLLVEENKNDIFKNDYNLINRNDEIDTGDINNFMLKTVETYILNNKESLLRISNKKHYQNDLRESILSKSNTINKSNIMKYLNKYITNLYSLKNVKDRFNDEKNAKSKEKIINNIILESLNNRYTQIIRTIKSRLIANTVQNSNTTYSKNNFVNSKILKDYFNETNILTDIHNRNNKISLEENEDLKLLNDTYIKNVMNKVNRKSRMDIEGNTVLNNFLNNNYSLINKIEKSVLKSNQIKEYLQSAEKKEFFNLENISYHSTNERYIKTINFLKNFFNKNFLEQTPQLTRNYINKYVNKVLLQKSISNRGNESLTLKELKNIINVQHIKKEDTNISQIKKIYKNEYETSIYNDVINFENHRYIAGNKQISGNNIKNMFQNQSFLKNSQINKIKNINSFIRNSRLINNVFKKDMDLYINNPELAFEKGVLKVDEMNYDPVNIILKHEFQENEIMKKIDNENTKLKKIIEDRIEKVSSVKREQFNINGISEKIYKDIEKRFKSERQRRGMI